LDLKASQEDLFFVLSALRIISRLKRDRGLRFESYTW